MLGLGGVRVSAAPSRYPAFDDQWLDKWNAFALISKAFLDKLKVNDVNYALWDKVVDAGRRAGVHLPAECPGLPPLEKKRRWGLF